MIHVHVDISIVTPFLLLCLTIPLIVTSFVAPTIITFRLAGINTRRYSQSESMGERNDDRRRTLY